MKTRMFVCVSLAACILSVPAMADWNEGDPYKMHHPQLPDPEGWDVAFTTTLADDFQCTESGPITDVHLWTSWQGDVEEWPSITNIHLSIHSDIPAGSGPEPWSQPGDELWARDFKTFAYRQVDTGDQGWYDPIEPVWETNDHFFVYQINIQDIQDPFEQQKDEIYWLDVRVDMLEPASARMGWKTTPAAMNWNDDGVYFDEREPNPWRELRDPRPENDESLNFAFVIVPEPGTLLLGMVALLVLGLCRRRE